MNPHPPMLIVVMGVSGCGKSTTGEALAERLEIPFFDGDDFHPRANIEKMASGIPLSDADRTPWLAAIGDHATDCLNQGESLVIACSALKAAYRSQLRSIGHSLLFVHLHAPEDVISKRQAARTDHFMPPSLLPSQYATLESTANETDVIEVSVAQTVDAILDEATKRVLQRLP